MIIGEKISYLRVKADMSQEQLAEKLNVSRQSVSKWEMGQAIPQIDKVLMLCDIFCINADSLLRDNINIKPEDNAKNCNTNENKYFSTDGFRGEANVELTCDHAYKVGRFLGWYFSSPLSGINKSGHRPRIVIGKDTRRSSYMLEYAIAAGITSSGADAYMLHVITTPGVAYVTRQDEFDCGVMITASHNPYHDNGIKVLNKYGEKIDDSTASMIEAYIDGDLKKIGINANDLPFATKEKVGCIVDYVAGRNRYVGYLISVASHSYKNLRIGLDCANGASWMIAKAVFDALGAQTYLIGASPDGINVNLNCGSTHIEHLCEYVKENHLDVGFAFDGDADRCIAVDERGTVVDGDGILYLLAMRLKSRSMLDGNTVVATVMSNSGLFQAFDKAGIDYVQTSVGDRFVYEHMQASGYRLGGEQSGHIILKKYATTGDGLLTAIMITEEIQDGKTQLSKLVGDLTLYPQLTKSIPVKNKSDVMNDIVVKEKAKEINSKIAGKGRLLLRESGTEPVIRIMVECESKELCRSYAEELYSVIKQRGHCID